MSRSGGVVTGFRLQQHLAPGRRPSFVAIVGRAFIGAAVVGLAKNRRKVRRGTVVYCALEGGRGFKNRIVAFRQNRLKGHPGSVPFHLMSLPMSLVADHPAFLTSLRKTLGGAAPAVIVIDTLNRSLAGSESDDRDMAAYVKAADAIRNAFNCAVIIVHHCGHEGNRPRGHSSLMGAIDAQASVKRDTSDDIVATVELMKDGPQGDEFVSRLEVVDIGLDNDGDRIISCIIEPIEGVSTSRKNKAAKKLTKGANIALAALQEAIGECGEVPPASNHIPPGMKIVTMRTSPAATIWVGGRRRGSAPEGRARTRTKRTHLFKRCSFVRLFAHGRLEDRGS